VEALATFMFTLAALCVLDRFLVVDFTCLWAKALSVVSPPAR
jgi:hypothetical protein